MIQYRSFRNTDPPGLVEVWNDAFPGRGSFHLRNSTPLERCIFSKAYFDPDGLIVAERDGTLVGFGHAGFGPNRQQNGVSQQVGVTCLVGVRSGMRGRGVGGELLSRCEGYLKERGVTDFYAGPMRPLNPFYFGMYGGCDSAGVLASDAQGGPFLERHGYKVHDTRLVFQRRLDTPVDAADARFPAVRRRFDVRIVPRIPLCSWWQENVLGMTEPVEFRLEDKLTNNVAASAHVWELDGFSWRWNQPSVGVLNLTVNEELRGHGLGKFLLMAIVRYLQDQFFGLVEIQTMQANTTAVNLYKGLGFEQVDIGRLYRKSSGNGRSRKLRLPGLGGR